MAELHAVRREMFASVGYDLQKLYELLQRQEAESGRQFVRLPPRRPEGWVDKDTQQPEAGTSCWAVAAPDSHPDEDRDIFSLVSQSSLMCAVARGPLPRTAPIIIEMKRDADLHQHDMLGERA